MELWELLGIRPGLTAVIGSGGKTSLLRVLAQELSHRGTVLLATTTHIMRPNWCPFAATAAELCDGFAHSPIVCAGSYNPEGKLTAPDFPGWQYAANFVLVEADGSKRLPAKAHAAWEPVIPSGTANVIWIVGASGLGKPINDAVHRPELFCERCGCELTDTATPERVAQVLNAELRMLNLNNARIMLNQVDTLGDPTMADRFEAALAHPVVASSLK